MNDGPSWGNSRWGDRQADPAARTRASVVGDLNDYVGWITTHYAHQPWILRGYKTALAYRHPSQGALDTVAFAKSVLFDIYRL